MNDICPVVLIEVFERQVGNIVKDKYKTKRDNYQSPLSVIIVKSSVASNGKSVNNRNRNIELTMPTIFKFIFEFSIILV